MSFEDINTTKTPEEQLGDFFDNTKGLKLKQELSAERYEEERLEFIQDGIDQEDRNCALEEKIHEARYHPVTGLENREYLFNKISPKIKKLFGLSDDDRPNDKEWLKIIENEDNDFNDDDFYIMMSDVSFLGLVNDTVDHDSGDELLKRIAQAMQATLGNCFHHGGDEITSTFDLPLEKLSGLRDKTRKEVGELKDIPGIESSGLIPNIDIGFAKFSEGLKIYKELLTSEPKQKDLRKDILRNLENTWLALAEKEMSINKAKERIHLLINRANNNQETDDLTKAAYNIKKHELKDLQNIYNAGGDIDEEIYEFIKRKEIVKFDQAKPREKKKIELILKHLDIL